MEKAQSIAMLAQHIGDRTTRGIAMEMAALIRSGTLPVGTQLPPVRELAEALGVSPATISAAWGELRSYNVISGQGRTGVWVTGDNASPHPQRFEIVNAIGEHIVADLSLAHPDPALMPDLARALREGLSAPHLNEYRHLPILAPLREAAEKRWPYRPEAMLATNGGFEALLLTLQTLLRPGVVVALEDPTTARILDMLEFLKVNVVPVRCDSEGPIPDALRHVLKRKPAAFIYQPRTHSTTGTVVSYARREALAKLLEDSDTIVIEDDGLGDISGHPPASLGTRFPNRTVHILSYSKAYGPDLRVAVLSGSREIVDRIQSFRNFGARWTSRILQGAAAWMLGDANVESQVIKAREVYTERRNALLTALRERRIDTNSHDGLAVWIPVESEQFAVLTMAARGIAVLSGSRCCVENRQSHIRVAIGQLTQNVDVVSDAIALAARLR
ncbi:PLP-dependent aminotransferase family protein [Burkholderia multivorans]|nr:PLP-dependent aminotransferase family protein [Burkholderia multivorans]